jgi:hypothetical protein
MESGNLVSESVVNGRLWTYKSLSVFGKVAPLRLVNLFPPTYSSVSVDGRLMPVNESI